ncbi:MAG: hypothetical protein Kow00104_02520 [Rhodothalassiaceae bacterium]
MIDKTDTDAGGKSIDRDSSIPDPTRIGGFHDRLKKIVFEVSGNAAAFARKAGISQSGFHNIMKGGEPSRPILVAIAQAADVSIHWLATGEGPMRHKGILPHGEARQLARSTMSATETLPAAGRELDAERQRLTGGSPARETGGAIDVDILAHAEQLVDDWMKANGRTREPGKRAALVAETYALIADMVNGGLDENAAVEVARNNIVRLRSAG